jgi:hypothetical protein
MILRSKATKRVKSLLSGVSLLPSTGEWCYSTTPSFFDGEYEDYDQNTQWDDGASGKTNFTRAMDNLEKNLPRVSWVSLVTSWFGSDLRLGECEIKPKAEQRIFDQDYDEGAVVGGLPFSLFHDNNPVNPDFSYGAISGLSTPGVFDKVTNTELKEFGNNFFNPPFGSMGLGNSDDINRARFLQLIDAGAADFEYTYDANPDEYGGVSGEGLLGTSAHVLRFWDTDPPDSGMSVNQKIDWLNDNATMLEEHIDIETLVVAVAIRITGTIPPGTRSMTIGWGRDSTSNRWVNSGFGQFLVIPTDVVLPAAGVVNTGESQPHEWYVQNEDRTFYDSPSADWNNLAEYNPVYVQWTNERNGGNRVTGWDVNTTPPGFDSFGYTPPTDISTQSAGVVLMRSFPDDARPMDEWTADEPTLANLAGNLWVINDPGGAPVVITTVASALNDETYKVQVTYESDQPLYFKIGGDTANQYTLAASATETTVEFDLYGTGGGALTFETGDGAGATATITAVRAWTLAAFSSDPEAELNEVYNSWNHADTGTGGPGGNIPVGTYRYSTWVWSPVARQFNPVVRAGGPGEPFIAAVEEPIFVSAETWTELTIDFDLLPADPIDPANPDRSALSYVEIIPDYVGYPEVPWFYQTDTTIYDLSSPRLNYGGTPADRSVIEGIIDMKARGLNVMFYPFILMDITDAQGLPDPDGVGTQGAHPWRGRIRPMDSDQGTSQVTADVEHFFGTAQVSDFSFNSDRQTIEYTGDPDDWGFRRFILHYAFVCALAGGVDAFCVGTEMIGLTTARDGPVSFPAVQKLIELTDDVREVLGEDCQLTYAADWSEFMPRNYEDGGFNSIFHLDPLWAHSEINFIGIDNYLPISDWRGTPLAIDDALFDSIYDQGYLKSQIEGGERYDYQYLNEFDRDNQVRTPLTEWRYKDKDHKSWWGETHYDIVAGTEQASPTAYVPKLKRLVYTEYGCAAIDKGTNQPNKFLDPKSIESTAPYYSTGARDDRMQSSYYQAMTEYWQPESGHNPTSPLTGEYCIDPTMMFAWTWDARPWPAFPRMLDVWSDGENYPAGHWLQGRQWIETN